MKCVCELMASRRFGKHPALDAKCLLLRALLAYAVSN